MRLSHPSSRRTIVGLAIIDDQSGLTFVDPIVKEALKLPRQVLKNSMQGVVTIEGESKAKPCHIVHDLVVTPLDGQSEMVMPPAVMQNPIPDALDQVPSKHDVAHTRGYEEFAHHFPDKDVNWPTLLLIGRDCMLAQCVASVRTVLDVTNVVIPIEMTFPPM